MRLLLKQWGAFRGALIALAIVVLVATFAVTAWPRAVTGLLTRDVQYRVEQPTANVTAVQASQHVNAITPANTAVEGAAGYVWRWWGPSLVSAHDKMPAPLRSAMREPQWTS